ncbi:hypothetical protein D3C86_1857890 [compost metagenome]
MHLKVRIVILTQYSCYFPAPVCSIVETDHHIVRLDSCNRTAIRLANYNWFYKLVSDTFAVRLFDSKCCIAGRLPDTFSQ